MPLELAPVFFFVSELQVISSMASANIKILVQQGNNELESNLV